MSNGTVDKESLAVVISTYNRPAFLALVLDGYRQQTDKQFSVYIADDGSRPETTALIEKISAYFPVPIHHIWQKDDGFRKSRIHNKTIRRITESHTLLTDGDCIPLPGLVAAHRRFAIHHPAIHHPASSHPAAPSTAPLAKANDYFISGSRILLSKSWTEKLCKCSTIHTDKPILWWIKKRLSNNINRLLPLILSTRLAAPNTQLEGIRGCHLSCPTAALLRINGFDESFEGWGREDSDLTARLLHAGLKRRNLRGQPVLHLWHPECSRQQLGANDIKLQACLDEHRIEAVSGLKQL
ncbi:MAG: galactosyltransferase-related protein [Mariprofundus sp.]|nr:galactosyltransferase-related protein [Mariprofundus sp.]